MPHILLRCRCWECLNLRYIFYLGWIPYLSPLGAGASGYWKSIAAALFIFIVSPFWFQETFIIKVRIREQLSMTGGNMHRVRLKQPRLYPLHPPSWDNRQKSVSCRYPKKGIGLALSCGKITSTPFIPDSIIWADKREILRRWDLRDKKRMVFYFELLRFMLGTTCKRFITFFTQ